MALKNDTEKPQADHVVNVQDTQKNKKPPLSDHKYFKFIEKFVVASCFMFFGPSLTLLNKYVMTTLGFNYPMLLSSLGLITCTIFSFVAVATGYAKLQHKEQLTWEFYLKNAAPVGLCSACTLAMGNACFMYLSVSFVLMLKAFTPVVILIVATVAGVDQPTLQVTASVLIICIGTCISSYGEVAFSVIGFAYFMGASLTEALKLVLTQKLLNNLKFGIVEGLYVLCPFGVVFLISASLVSEFPTIIEKKDYMIVYNNPGTFFMASIFGLMIQFLVMKVIQMTSGVTLKVVTTFRNACTIGYAVLVFGEVLTAIQIFGYVISTVGFAGYNYFKAMQVPTKAVHAAKVQRSPAPLLKGDHKQ